MATEKNIAGKEMERFDWVEKAAIENLKEKAQISDLLRKEAMTLLTLLLSGAGAALYFAAKKTDLMYIALVVSGWLFLVALLLSLLCIKFGNFPAIWNEPKQLNDKNFSFKEAREGELQNLQARIEEASHFIETKSTRLNNCIVAACLTPAIAVIAEIISWAIDLCAQG